MEIAPVAELDPAMVRGVAVKVLVVAVGRIRPQGFPEGLEHCSSAATAPRLLMHSTRPNTRSQSQIHEQKWLEPMAVSCSCRIRSPDSTLLIAETGRHACVMRPVSLSQTKKLRTA